MSDQDNLRDRIERQLCMFFDENYDGHLFDASQAIIDEFGMTKEWQSVSRQILNDGTAIENPTQSRIVGKWEEQ